MIVCMLDLKCIYICLIEVILNNFILSTNLKGAIKSV